MTDGRRVNDPALQQQAFNRLAKRIDDSLATVSDRIEAGFDRVNDRIDRLDRDVAAGDLDRDARQREVHELRLAVDELRDAFGLAGESRAPSPAPRPAPTDRPFWKSWTGAAVAVALGFTAVVTALDKLPSAIRKVESFWLYMRGPDEVKRPAEKAATDGR